MSEALRSEVIEACRQLCLLEGADPDKKVLIDNNHMSAWVANVPKVALVIKTVERERTKAKWKADIRIRCLEMAVRITGKSHLGEASKKADELMAYVLNGEDPADSAKEIEQLKDMVQTLTNQIKASEQVAEAGRELMRRQTQAPLVTLKDGVLQGLNGTKPGNYRLVADA